MADKKKTSSLNQMAEPNIQDGGKEKEQNKSSKTVTREQLEPKERESKTVVRERENKSNRRDTKTSVGTLTRLRNSRIVRFFFEAYYELRHKVTWPTFEQARNLTLVVLVLSAVLGILLGLVDLGLSQLFFLINNLPGIK